MNINILLTRACNQGCYYCNNAYVVDSSFAIDIDKIKDSIKVLSTFNSDMSIELSGGEPGLVSNLIEIVDLYKQQNFIKTVNVLSNGLLRKNFGVEFLFDNKHEYYKEHTQLDLDENKILLFDNDINYDHNLPIEHVIILTPKTLKSLFNYYDFWYEKLSDKDIEFKLVTPKTFRPDDKLIEGTKRFYKLWIPKTKQTKRSIQIGLRYINKYYNPSVKEQEMCSISSKSRFIDIEHMKFGRCSMDVIQSDKVELNKINQLLQTINPMCL